MKLRNVWMFAVVAGVAGTACVDKVDPDKGQLEDELPPGTDPAPLEGKGDGNGVVVPLSVESAHPYTNNLDKAYPVALDGRVPSCANRARVHFASLSTEAGYDYVHLEGASGRVQTLDGNKTDLWSSWVDLTASKSLAVRLTTDYSVTRDGFRIDAVEVEGHVICPAIAYVPCPAGTVDVNPSRKMCECQARPTCVPDAQVSFEHAIGGGFTGQVTGHRAAGTTASNVVYKPGQPDQVKAIGTIDHARLQAVVTAFADARWLAGTSSSMPSNWNETLAATIGAASRSLTLPQGSFATADAALATQVESLFTCDQGALTCGAGYECQEGQCTAVNSCVCPLNYDPVCGVDGRTYSNGCAIGCAGVATAHAGQCGAVGDGCGTILGKTCQGGNKCRYAASTFEPPFPDAGGACVASTYCDAAPDCSGLAHPSVLGNWACEQNACAWKAGNPWHAVTGFRFTTAHPYLDRSSVWMKLDAPAGARKLRLVVNGRFELESGYDYLEVWSRSGSSWAVTKRFTGTTGPALSDELVGTEFWLRLATDVSVTKYGFDLTAEASN